MRTLNFLNPSRPTQNKIRWTVDVDGAPFHLYIPKWRVPKKIPMGLDVVVDENVKNKQISIETTPLDYPIKVIVQKHSTHTRTIRYRPSGENPNQWEIGEPYIPKDILTEPYPEKVYLEVRWDYTEGVWELNQ
ncbi:MAG: hypothetical protein C0396_04595 [Anaerolinea sp.]|nr:hypothetical protein [Anaerolinea sp.]